MIAQTFHSQPESNINTNIPKNVSSCALPSQTIVKAKLEMSEPGDHDEIEADSVANEIVNGGKISRKISEGSSSSGVRVSTAMESQLSHMQGGGHSMPSGLQSMMENGFGRDFSQVRLHTDSKAAEMSSSINAKAFTLGNDIYFNRGQYSPNTTEGQRLVAHELTHVAQGNGKLGRDKLEQNEDIEYYESEPEYIRTRSSKEIAYDREKLLELKHRLHNKYSEIHKKISKNIIPLSNVINKAVAMTIKYRMSFIDYVEYFGTTAENGIGIVGAALLDPYAAAIVAASVLLANLIISHVKNQAESSLQEKAEEQRTKISNAILNEFYDKFYDGFDRKYNNVCITIDKLLAKIACEEKDFFEIEGTQYSFVDDSNCPMSNDLRGYSINSPIEYGQTFNFYYEMIQEEVENLEKFEVEEYKEDLLLHHVLLKMFGKTLQSEGAAYNDKQGFECSKFPDAIAFWNSLCTITGELNDTRSIETNDWDNKLGLVEDI